ncbi:homoserine kinase [Allomyces macrogynus ATCC 38327]|uniref:Homoserine kinase n=1 Tax=Allomyces macrogynus (strain ATCC 38327) TaxID=578462 RepID=A0A0L0T637_ALLM3|nr:homoserine kinase [Allomyces macrogynus ATCC 38327]|eukprot:KNE69994.1 homoserine kinase [Allomyces macrogynus ATCC 38327]
MAKKRANASPAKKNVPKAAANGSAPKSAAAPVANGTARASVPNGVPKTAAAAPTAAPPAATGPAQSVTIRVPASTANLGAGFDTLGMALGLYLEVHATCVPISTPSLIVDNVEYAGNDPGTIPADPRANLITATMLDMLGSQKVGKRVKVRVSNPIPLGRGLGSSGSAVVAGVVLANWVGECGWSVQEILEKVVAVEGHPDNVAPSLLGGMVAAYLTPKSVYAVNLPLDPSLRIFAAVPDYHVPTAAARAALPATYTMPDIVHSLQRVAVLTAVLANPTATQYRPGMTQEVFADLLDDVLHQPHRAHLLPGFESVRTALRAVPHVLGACVSGAGPTVLILAVDGVDPKAVEKVVRGVYEALPHPERPGKKVGVDVLPLDVVTGTEVVPLREHLF